MYITSGSSDNLALFLSNKDATKNNNLQNNQGSDITELNNTETVSLKSLNESKLKNKTISLVSVEESNKSSISELKNVNIFSSPNINFKNADEIKLTEKTSKISELIGNVEGAEDLKNLLSKIKPDYKLTKDDYALLSKLNNEIKNKMNSGNLNPSDKLALETFSKSFEQLNDCKEKMEVAHSTYINTKNQTDNDVVELTKTLDSTLKKLKSSGITPVLLEQMMQKRIEAGVSVEDLNSMQNGTASFTKVNEIKAKFAKVGIGSELLLKFASNYKEVLMAGLIKTTLENYKKESDKAGNEPSLEFSLYQSYIQKFISASQHGATDPQKLYEVMATYDNLVKKSDSINNNSGLSAEEKKNQLKSLVSEYTKDNPAQSSTIMALIDRDAVSNFDALKAVDILGNAVSSLSNSGVNNSETKEASGKSHDITHHLIAGASEKDLEIAKTATVESFNFIKAEPKLNKLFSKFDSDLTKLALDTTKYVSAEKVFNLKSIEFNSSLTSFRNTFYNVTNDSSLQENKKEFDKLVEKANEIQDLMDLSFNFNDKKADVSSLLESLRSIIVDLDLSLRSIKGKTDSKIKIDTDFLKNLKENEKRHKKMDEVREIMNKVFNSSKEVNIVNVSDTVKKETFKNDLKSLSLAIQELSAMGINSAGVL